MNEERNTSQEQPEPPPPDEVAPSFPSDRVEESKQSAEPEKISAITADKKSRVLIIEDDKSNRLFLEAFLKSRDLSFDSYERGEDGVEVFVPGTHRVVLMDLFLPGMDGEQAARLIRKKTGNHPVYIIAQTAGIALVDKDRLLKDGLDDFIAKPIRVSLLTQIVQRGFEKTGLAEER